MLKKKIGIILAILGIFSAGWVVRKSMASPPTPQLVAEPALKPYQKSIAASGIIESLGENVAVGSPCDGIVQDVYVKVWQPVKKGDPLFQIDSRELQAELKIDQARETVALRQHKQIQDQLDRLLSIKDPRAISKEELRSKENEERIAFATLEQIRMEKERTLTRIERLLVRSPIDGIVLQKNIKSGEFLLASHIDTPPIIVGDMKTLQVRVDIDEQNASRMIHHASGIAYPKNRPDFAIPLIFNRIEPYVVPKKSLTGSGKEKVDTRVLQVIYTFTPPEEVSLYIGQQVDVFINREAAQ